MGISKADQQAINEAVERNFYIQKDKHGNKYIQLDADIRDTNEGLLQIAYERRHAGFPDDRRYDEYVYDADHEMINALQDEISEWYEVARFEIEDQTLRIAGFNPSCDQAEDQMEYFREQYYIEPPFDHFLHQGMRVNLMLGTGPESNLDFGAIHDQCEALCGNLDPQEAALTLESDTALTWLIKQQGHTMTELQATMNDYIDYFDGDDADRSKPYEVRLGVFLASHNRFLTSVCEEVDNAHNYMNTLTVLTELSMKEFADLMQPGKEIVLPKGSMLGIFNPWLGGGSILGIELEQNLVIPSDLIWDAQIEGTKLFSQYSVDQTFGLISSAWQPALAVRDHPSPEKDKPTLDSRIQSAADRSPGRAEPKQNTHHKSQR